MASSSGFASGGAGELDHLVEAVEALDQYCAAGLTLFPEPYSDSWGPDPEGLGDRSMREYLETFEFAPVVRDWVEAMCCAVAFGPLDQSAATEWFRTYALSGWSVGVRWVSANA